MSRCDIHQYVQCTYYPDNVPTLLLTKLASCLNQAHLVYIGPCLHNLPAEVGETNIYPFLIDTSAFV